VASMPVVGREWCPSTAATSLTRAPGCTMGEAALCRKAGAPTRGRSQTPARVKAGEAIRLLAAAARKGREGARPWRQTTRLLVVGRPHRR